MKQKVRLFARILGLAIATFIVATLVGDRGVAALSPARYWERYYDVAGVREGLLLCHLTIALALTSFLNKPRLIRTLAVCWIVLAALIACMFGQGQLFQLPWHIRNDGARFWLLLLQVGAIWTTLLLVVGNRENKGHGSRANDADKRPNNAIEA